MQADKTIVKQYADRHLMYSCMLIAVLTVITMFVLEYLDDRQYAAELEICTLFSFVSAYAYNRTWKSVLMKGTFDITRFYLVASGARMLAAALAVLIYCVVVQQSEAILLFVTMFLAFYFIMLVFDSVYFARIEKGQKLKTKK